MRLYLVYLTLNIIFSVHAYMMTYSHGTRTHNTCAWDILGGDNDIILPFALARSLGLNDNTIELIIDTFWSFPHKCQRGRQLRGKLCRRGRVDITVGRFLAPCKRLKYVTPYHLIVRK